MSRVLMGLFVLGVLSGCGSSSEAEPERQGRLVLREGQSLAGMAECGVDTPSCASGQGCFSFTVEGQKQVRCVNLDTLCTEILACTGGTECIMLLSYPGQVMCAGRCEGSACDESVSSPAP